MAPKVASVLEKCLFLFLFVVHVGLTAWIFTHKPFFEAMRFFSYVSLLVQALAFCAGALALLSGRTRLYALWVLPLAIELGVIVGLAIIIIVFGDGTIYTRNMDCHASDWPDRFAKIHTQDFLVHTFPAIAALLLAALMRRVTRSHVRALWHFGSARQRATWAAWTVVAGMTPLYAYALCADWKTRYAERVDGRWGWIGLSLVGFAIGTIYLLALLPSKPKLLPLVHVPLSHVIARAPAKRRAAQGRGKIVLEI
jgi:hypothetical protein